MQEDYMTEETLLFKKTYGAVAGAALGDSIGGITEAWNYHAVARKWGKITGLRDEVTIRQKRHGMPPYTTTDDTHHRLAIFEAIFDKGGLIDAYDMAEGILNHLNLSQMARTQQELYKKSASGYPAHEIGIGQWVEGTPCFACLPIGILHACDPYGAAKDAYEVLSVWISGLGQEAPIAVVSALAEAFKPSATRESIAEASQRYCGPRVAEYLDLVYEVASQFDDPWEAIPTFFDKLTIPDLGLDRYHVQRDKLGMLGERRLDDMGTSGSPLEMAGLGLAFFHVANGDPMAAICGAASLGRDCDGFAGIAGAITGAWKGIDAFDIEDVNKVDAADKSFFGEGFKSILELAQCMQEPMLNAMRMKREGVEAMQALL